MNAMGFTSRTTLTLALLLAATACDKDDIGKPCPQLDVESGAEREGSRLETQEIVAVDPAFPCEEFICVATDGRPGYCSRKCREDAGCPAGFSCREVQRTGSFAGEKFCVWRHCEKASDCGDIDEFCCSPVDATQAIEDLKLCGFADDKDLCP